jgi:hypothetical protein
MYSPYAVLPEPRPLKQPAGATARLIGWLIAATGVVVVVAAFLTWHSTDDWFGQGPLSLRGLGPDKQIGELVVSQGWGFLSLLLALVAISFAIVRMCGRLSLTAAILGVVMGALILVYALAAAFTDDPGWAEDARGNDIDTSGLDWSTGIGAWLTLAAGGAMLVISIVGIVKRR